MQEFGGTLSVFAGSRRARLCLIEIGNFHLFTNSSQIREQVAILAKPILVTGATGFIGTHLTRALADRGREVFWMSSTSYGRISNGEIACGTPYKSADGVLEAIQEIQPRSVFHLATHFVGVHAPNDIDDLIAANVTFGTTVAEGSAQIDAKFIYVGSAWQRFEGRRTPVSLYAATKNAFEEVLRYYVDVRGLTSSEAFLFDTYGPGDSRGKLVSRLLSLAQSGGSLSLGSPTKLLNLSYVTDVVEGLVWLEEADCRSDWVIRQANPLSLEDLVDAVQRVSGRSLEISWNPEFDRPREMRTDWQFGRVVEMPNLVSLEAGLNSLWRTEYAK
jgi:nucleoside-diphosphate-sugar epimerase